MMNARRFLFAALIVMMPLAASATFDPAAMREKYVAGATYQTMGFSGSALRDVDGLPGDELLIGYRNMWQLLRWDETAKEFRQIAFVEYSYGDVFGDTGELVSTRFAQFDRSAPVEVVVMYEGGSLQRFALDGSAGAVWKPAATGVFRFGVYDVDGEPGDEIVFQTPTELSAWKWGAAAPLWRLAMPSRVGFAIGQFDSDPQLELAITAGTVIDLKTLQTQWRYPLEFGAGVIAADVDGDGVSELIGCRERQCDAFDVNHQTNLWETFLPYPYAVGALAAADVNGDGRAELFEGDAQHGKIRKIDGMTGNVLAEFEKIGGTNFILLGDLNGDCSKEVVWAKDGDNTALDTFHITDAATMKTFWSSTPEEVGSSGVAIDDFSGTGHPSILWSNRGGSIERFVDFTTGRHREQERSDQFDSYAWFLGVAAAAQLDSDPAVEYVLPDSVSFGGSDLVIYDGATHAVQAVVQIAPSADSITSLTAGDLTGDGVADLVAGTSIMYFPKTHPDAVVAVDGAKRTVLWRTTGGLSHYLIDDCSGCNFEVLIADVDADGAKEVLSLVPTDGLYAFNGKTGALLWHSILDRTTTENADIIASAFTVADVDPSPGAEIITLTGTHRLVIYDSKAATAIRAKDIKQYGLASAVQAADLDGDGVKEIIVVTRAGLLIFSPSLDLLWTGGFLLPAYSLGNQIAVRDVDGDGTPEIVVPSAHSLRVFEYRAATVDVVPPTFGGGAARATAQSGCCHVAVDWDAAADAASMPVTYRVYRSTAAGFTPAPASLVAQTSDRTFVDRSMIGGTTYHYAIRAVDAAGNESTQMLRTSVVAPNGCPARRRTAGGR